MTRIKNDIVRELMSHVAVEKTTAKELIESLLRNIKDNLASGNEVMLSGFGNFK